MKRQRSPALAIAIAVLLAAGCAQQPAVDDGHAAAEADTHGAVDADPHADADAHDDAHGDPHADLGFDYPVPPDHVPWTPDAPLQAGMARVRAALADADRNGAGDPAVVQAAAGEVDAAIDYMFANCKLEPEPDVALHAVLARLMAGSEQLQANPGDLEPLADMRAAVANYEQLFDDPAA